MKRALKWLPWIIAIHFAITLGAISGLMSNDSDQRERIELLECLIWSQVE